MLLSVRGLRVVFESSGLGLGAPRRVVALDNSSFELRAGQTLGVVGESGSGKTTLGRAVLRLIEPTSGTIHFSGQDLRLLNARELRRARRWMQIIFQDPGSSFNPRLTIGDAMTEPLLLHGVAKSGTDAMDRAAAVLRTCGMDASCMRKYPHEFSGGQKQRIAIARAVSLKPRLLVCDEPTSALDVSIQAQILNLLKDLQREHGMAYLFISHDMGVIDHMCDHVMVLRQGNVVESGTREQVIQNPAAEYTRELLSAVPGR